MDQNILSPSQFLLNVPPPPLSLNNHKTKVVDACQEALNLLHQATGELRIALWEIEESCKTTQNDTLLTMIKARHNYCLELIEAAKTNVAEVQPSLYMPFVNLPQDSSDSLLLSSSSPDSNKSFAILQSPCREFPDLEWDNDCYWAEEQPVNKKKKCKVEDSVNY